MSFRATYFGWQGWLFETDRTAIAIDPLLVDQVGRGPHHTRIDFVFREAREVTLDRLPPLDALVISHEHEDHFSVPTLVRLDRRIPLYVSRRVSAAARSLLGELGFAVRYVDHGETLAIGDLEIRLFGADQTPGVASFDEWEVLAYLVRHRGGAGGLFSNVDIALTGEMAEAVRATAARDRQLLLFVRGEVTLSSGAMPTADGEHPRGAAATPIEEVVPRLRAGEHVVARPGTVFELEAGELVRVAPETAFLRTIPGPPPVPRREFSLPAGVMPERPLLGTRASELDRPELEAALRELAEHMYGRHIYRYLMTLPARYAGKRIHSFALVFLTAADGPEWLYEYVPGACAFRAVDIDFDAAVERYLGVVVLWVSDYLAVVRGEVEPRAIHCATQEDWAIEDPGLAKVRDVLWSFYHPQRFPARVLAQYRRAVALETPDAVWRAANPVRRRAAERATPADPAQKPRPAPRPTHEPRRPGRARAKHAPGAPVSKHPRRAAHGRRRPAV
jgi:beta-lactamase family protein